MNSRLFSAAVAMVTIFAFAIGIAWWQRSISSDAMLRVGVLKHEASLPIYVAKDEGYFRSLPFEVQVVELPLADHMPALLAKRVDAIAPTSFPVLMSVMADSAGEVYAIFPGAEVLDAPPVYGFIVKKFFGGSSVRDFAKGTVIAINATTAMNVSAIMLAAGVPRHELPTIRIAARDAAIQAVSSGVAVAAIMDQPALAAAQESSDLRVVEANPRARYISNPYWSGAGAVLVSTWTARSNELHAFVQAVDKAIQYSREHPRRARAVLAKYTGVSITVAENSGGYFFPTSTESVPLADIATAEDALIEGGILRRRVDMAHFFPPDLY